MATPRTRDRGKRAGGAAAPFRVDQHPPPTLAGRLGHELKEYAILSAYLYVCLGAVLLYRSSLLVDHGVGELQFGIAAVKALVLGKFMLLGRAAGIGEGHTHRPLVVGVLRASVGFLVLLVALTVVEELIVGWIHGRAAAATLSELVGERKLEVVASCLLLWLILLPYLGLRELSRKLGPDAFRALLFGRGSVTGVSARRPG